MKSGQCPKCKNQMVYKSKSGIGYRKRDTFYVFTSAMVMPTPTEDYVCTTCGYFETYIADQGKLNEVAQKWEKVG
jgi:predicted nucleic-acid-binding Zn-ribbon protein